MKEDDEVVISIVDSVEKRETYPSVVERYYTTRFCNKLDGKTIDDHRIMFHSNRICLITLAPNHPVVRDKKPIARVDFKVSDSVDRSSNKVTGKGKKGAQPLDSHSTLCKIECDDGSNYTVYSCIKGKLVEVNENLIENPDMLMKKPNAEGYIAIVLPQIAKIEKWKTEMLTIDQYESLYLVA